MSDFEPAAEAVSLANADASAMSKNERLKVASDGLFYVARNGETRTFLDEVNDLDSGANPTIGNDAKELSKFFGIYRQQERGERGKKLDDHYFMVRIRNPGGGALSKEQWACLDAAAEEFADGTIRITSRQSIQYHHVYGPKLGPLIRSLNRGYRDRATLAACGDVNRNVMSSPIEEIDPQYTTGGFQLAEDLAEDLAPRTSAYFQIFLSDEEGRNAGTVHSEEPIYGAQYLPRKFKIGIAHPTDNSVDVLTQDVGLVPAADDGSLWDFYTGGGLGMTHNNPKTAALLGLHLGRVRREQVVDATRGVVLLQKENGERKNRKGARWKYTIRRLGTDFVKEQLKTRFGIELEDVPPVQLPPMQLHLGWNEQRDGRGWYGISVQSGRMGPQLRKAVMRAVNELDLTVRLTAQQDILLCDCSDREALERILAEGGVKPPHEISMVRRNAMACPAKPTCGLAMTDAENVIPKYCDAIEAAGLGDVDVVIRMTGCPNNCARPPSAEIGIYGYGKNDHVILVGGSREGSRLAHTLFPRLPGEQMEEALCGILRAIEERNPEGLPAGEFLHRTPPEQLREWIGLAEA